MSLYQKHRPQDLNGLVGQEKAVAILSNMFNTDNVPHAMLLVGPSGTGKTTIARIIKNQLECSDHDFTELNCADFRGIEMVRDIRQRMGLSPIAGKCRVWLLDEIAQMTSDAQNGLLKMLEDTPKHIYFLLATTNAEKLLKTIHTRCTEIKVRSLTVKELGELVADVYQSETKKTDLSDEVIEKIADMSDGSARKALVLLESVIGLGSDEEQLEALEKSSSAQESISLCRALLDPRTGWPAMASILSGLTEEPEKLRWMVLGYMRSVLLKSGGKVQGRAFLVIQAFRDNFYDSKGAGLAAACYEIICGK